MAYEIGKWTESTRLLLKFIDERNQDGNHPRLKDLKNGTFKNWIYQLKTGGYVEFSDGFSLTEKGKNLLIQLNTNPPKSRRGQRRKSKRDIAIENTSPHTEGYEIVVRGTDTLYQALVDKGLANEIIKVISELRMKVK